MSFRLRAARRWLTGVPRKDRGIRRTGGFTLIEIVVALVMLGILTTSAAPPVQRWLRGMKVRSALDRVAAEIYRARSTAVADGFGSRLVVHSRADGCIDGLRVMAGADPLGGIRARFDLPGLCIRHSGDSILTFNSRGMLRPPTRSFSAAYGPDRDSLLISIAGRIRRNY
jgi:prepilin-type N-terminal cleavage/methylation domain-containing protein